MPKKHSAWSIAALMIGLILHAGPLPAQTASNESAVADGAPSGSPARGRGGVTLSRVGDDTTTEGGWQIEFVAEGKAPVTGIITVDGVTLEHPGKLGEVDWEVYGRELKGTVASRGSGATLASFQGVVDGSGGHGTFKAANGQEGSWVWKPTVTTEEGSPIQ